MNKLNICIVLFGSMLIGGFEVCSQPIQHQNIEDASYSSGIINLPININQSLVKWRGTEMWGRGSHEGNLKLIQGNLEIKEGELVGGNFIADMNSITVTDIPKTDPIPRRNLTGHLKSEDFFLVEEYPTARFEITNTKTAERDSLLITGKLTIRDVTKAISFKAFIDSGKENTISYEGDFSINRFDWNISYQGSYWDRITSIMDNNLVDAEMSISVLLVASGK